jgi:hypothetical protein
MAIDTELREPQWMPTPYILYSGRVDPNQGMQQLFDYFIRFKTDEAIQSAPRDHR